MARTWLSVTVELLGGRGGGLWPPPGRIFAVGPSHTFRDLADAINGAFARWDRSHLSVFTLADGRVVTDEETGAETTADAGGPLTDALDLATAKVASTLGLGAEFQYVYDPGDDWTHRCMIDTEKIDPEQELGIRPSTPLPYWGWGAIPDQYGRRWADDPGEGPVPARPAQPDPMLTHEWPGREQLPALDMTALRRAIAISDADLFLSTIRGRHIDDVLQQVGAGIPMALEQRPEEAGPVALSVHHRLTLRFDAGDRELAEDLLARLRGEPLPGRGLPVDLEMVATLLETDPAMMDGGYLDLRTGDVLAASDTDPMEVGDDAAIDVDEEPDRWLRLEPLGSHEGWRDMADFAGRQHDDALTERLERAIEGRGAFRRFRDLVHDEGLFEQWDVFATDRQLGRAREYLAAEGIRVDGRAGPDH